MLSRLVIALAAAMGIGGVLLYAAAAHATDGAGSQGQFSLSTGALMLLTHAPVLLAVAALSRQARRATVLNGAAIVLGLATALFAASVSVQHLTDYEVTAFVGAGPPSAIAIVGAWVVIGVVSALGG
ncbi:MAG: DUF423 domain-containing protein [Pseudomonadota bacterium]